MHESIGSQGMDTAPVLFDSLQHTRKRLGILGGSFNPVTQGHIYLAGLAMQRFGLKQVMLLPCGDPPHKTQGELAPAQDRLAMVRLAAAELPGLICSEMEIIRAGKTYTVDTLEILHATMPNTDLFYILGTDTLLDLWSWRNIARVAQLCTLLVFMRPGDDQAHVLDAAEELRVELAAQVQVFLDMGMDVSASRVRTCLAKGQSVRGMVPDTVRRYIEEHNLYATVQPGSP